MSVWPEIFLGIIAVATLAIAIAQVGVMVVAGRLSRRVERLSDQLEQELKPLFGNINAIGRDAARAAALATTQVERADRLFADLAQRVERAMDSVHTSLGTPAREGRALLSGFKAAIRELRELRQSSGSRQTRSEEEDVLFI